MVQALINISEHANRILNVIKAKHSLKDKSQAIDVLTYEYEEKILEPSFKPEFTAGLLELDRRVKTKREKIIKAKKISELFK